MVTRKGCPAAVLVNVDEYERLKATIDVLGDTARQLGVEGMRAGRGVR